MDAAAWCVAELMEVTLSAWRDMVTPCPSIKDDRVSENSVSCSTPPDIWVTSSLMVLSMELNPCEISPIASALSIWSEESSFPVDTSRQVSAIRVIVLIRSSFTSR